MRKLLTSCAVAGLIAVLGTTAAGTNVLTNPGAETGDLTGWTVIDESEGGAVGAMQYILTPPLTPPAPNETGPHTGTYLFSGGRTTATTVEDVWWMTQTVATGGAPVALGHVWGVTNSTEYFRLIVSEHLADDSWNILYDSGQVNSAWTWTQNSFGPISLDPTTYEVEFKMGGRKPATVGSYNSSGLDDAYLELIPEPLTVLGMLMGLGGVGAYIRRRRMA